MTRPTIRLVERRTREVKLPRPEVSFLREHAREVMDLVPGFRAGQFRLTPRGLVGFFDGPSVRYEILPKYPWPNLLLILGLGSPARPSGESIAPTGGLLAALAQELAGQLRCVTARGLIPGYHEEDRADRFLRGRLRAADQLRDALSRAVPERFHITDTTFDLDTPWNRILRGCVSTLLSHPELSHDVRDELIAAAAPLDGMAVGPVSDDDFLAAGREPRVAHYNEAIALCRLIRDGVRASAPFGNGGRVFLIDLGRAFEGYLAATLTSAMITRLEWLVEAQPEFVIGSVRGTPLVLQPDIVVRREGETQVVLDAKWKHPGPDPADLHQILAYGTITGARQVGLVYPGRRFAQRDLFVGNRELRVSLFQLPVAGALEECRASGKRLARALKRCVRG